MTREQWMTDKIYEFTNENILPIFKAKEKTMEQSQVNKINNLIFFAQCDRKHPMQILMEMARMLTDDEFKQVNEKFKEMGYL